MSSGNTWGKVVGDTPKSTVKAGAANPAVEETNILEDAQAATKRAIDDWVESTGYNKGAMVAGAVATAVAEVFMPTAWWELVPVGKAGKILKKGGEAIGVLKKGEKAAEAAKDAKKAEEATKTEKQAEKKTESGGGGKDTQIKDKAKGRCTLRPYRKGCPPPQTPHHVVPDHCFKQPGAGSYYPGTEGVTHADGLCICVGGATKSTATDGSSISRVKGKFLDFYRKLADHGKIHVFTDAGEYALGKAGNPTGTTSLGSMEKLGSRVAGKVTGCDPADLEKQLRDYHQSKGLDPDTKVRADPFGQVKNLDSSQMGTGKRGGAETF